MDVVCIQWILDSVTGFLDALDEGTIKLWERVVAPTPNFIPHFCPILRLFLGVIKPRFSGFIINRPREGRSFSMPFGVTVRFPPSLGKRVA